MEEIPGPYPPVARPSAELMETLFEAKAQWHEAQARLPLREKFRILIEMQRQHLPLIARQRALEWWERPWDVEP